MFGTLVSNRLLKQMIEAKEIDIDPFEDSMLKATHYTLQPGRVLSRTPEGKWLNAHIFSESERYTLKPNEYVVVEVKQRVRILRDGIVGRFITTSSHVEGGLLIIAGQIDFQYGSAGEMLRFGVKNLLDSPNEIKRLTRLAHMEFFDLRGVTVDRPKLTAAEKSLWAGRRRDPEGDGPNYSRASD
jgi:deoxycytidine triphosphate deaminase